MLLTARRKKEPDGIDLPNGKTTKSLVDGKGYFKYLRVVEVEERN